MVLGRFHVKLSVAVVGPRDDASFGGSHSSPGSSLIHPTQSGFLRSVVDLSLRVGKDLFQGCCVNELHWKRC